MGSVRSQDFETGVSDYKAGVLVTVPRHSAKLCINTEILNNICEEVELLNYLHRVFLLQKPYICSGNENPRNIVVLSFHTSKHFFIPLSFHTVLRTFPEYNR